jgi:hypothetical protein
VTEVTEKVERAIARFDRVTRQLDDRGGPAREAARRERQRLNADLGRRVKRVGVAILLISIITIVVGLIMPIGMFGFLGAVGLAIGIAALLAFTPSGQRSAAPPSTDLPNGEMVQRFDSYLYKSRRALPAPAQAELDAISASLPTLRQTLERVETLDPNAQDARRLMSIHLPGLIDRTAKATRSTTGWSRVSRQPALPSARFRRIWRAPISRHSRRRAASSRRVTEKSGSTADSPLCREAMGRGTAQRS